ncbi:MAG: ankyrin repeat domain-containing protein [Chromatiales bacterium]|jgi:ankyrin repeat protein
MSRLSFLFLLTGMLLVTACSEMDKPSIGLYLAVKRGDIDQIERHIYWKTDINQLNIDGQTPLHEAASAGRIIIARLLLNNGADVNRLNSNKQTPLYIAVLNGRIQLAEMLIKKYGADFQPTELLFAAVENDVTDRDIYEFLRLNDANINSLNDEGNTPLSIAIQHGQRIVAKQLIANNADVNLADRQGRLPLDIATDMQRKDLIELLQTNGARTSK